jgi:hypothetical protein
MSKTHLRCRKARLYTNRGSFGGVPACRLANLFCLTICVCPDSYLGNLIAVLVQYINVALDPRGWNVHLDLLGNTRPVPPTANFAN